MQQVMLIRCPNAAAGTPDADLIAMGLAAG
jgi:hypothetical protein